MSLSGMLGAGLIVAWWYGGSVLANIAGQAVFSQGFLFPLTMAWLGMAAQVVTLAALWVAGGRKQAGPLASVRRLAPASAAVVMGNVFHRFALLSTTIPMLHTVKSLSTATTALMVYIFTGQRWPSTTAILMIIVGVAIALLPPTDHLPAFSWDDPFAPLAGLLTSSDDGTWDRLKPLAPAAIAMVSESARSVLAKGPLSQNTTPNLIKMQALSLLLLTPVVAVKEGARLIERVAHDEAVASNLMVTIAAALFGAVAMETGNFFSLSYLAPVTHSMANTIRSLVVVGAGVIFGPFVTRNFCIGCGLSVFGAMLHGVLAASARARAAANKDH
eukprot:TRINITY_DN20482_c0_g1_i1.p1 TRINITY_DN20482_c0_g1~~TRINITY_DN20482_c0_g1_i1.p1  ORF type:complete len:349 (+),score=93.41 TRINITY_DN20482_c0_g1_i1:56-1048(+)